MQLQDKKLYTELSIKLEEKMRHCWAEFLTQNINNCLNKFERIDLFNMLLGASITVLEKGAKFSKEEVAIKFVDDIIKNILNQPFCSEMKTYQ